MGYIQYYYRLNSFGHDNFDESEIKKYNHELASLDDLSSQFKLLKDSYADFSKERADIKVCVLPDPAEKYLNGVVEIAVYHKLKRKPFSKEIKENVFSMSITQGSPTGIDLYFYDTTDFEEVKKIFVEYINTQKIPDTSKWELISC